MSNFDFDKYKNSYDKVTVSDERKEEIIALMKKENNSTDNATKPQSQNKVITFKRTIVLVASLVLVISAIFSLNLFNHTESKKKSMQKFSISASLADLDYKNSNSNSFVISKEKKMLFLDEGNLAINAVDNRLSIRLIQFEIEGKKISNIDVKSKNNNRIFYTSYKSDDSYQTNSKLGEYNNIKYTKNSVLGWMPSSDKVDKVLQTNTENWRVYNEYLSDEITVTVYYSDGVYYSKDISISFDKNCNYLVHYIN